MIEKMPEFLHVPSGDRSLKPVVRVRTAIQSCAFNTAAVQYGLCCGRRN